MKPSVLFASAASIVFLGGVAVSTSNADAHTATCKIIHSVSGNSLKIESRFEGASSGSGQYTIAMRSVGGSNSVTNSQNGNFRKDAGESIVLGKTQVSANGQTFEVKMKVTFNGEVHRCEETIDATI